MASPDFHGCTVVLDYRETGLLELLPGAESRPLPVGDVLVCCDGMPRLLLERKTAADLAASIVDGRWKEQTARLRDVGLTRATSGTEAPPSGSGVGVGAAGGEVTLTVVGVVVEGLALEEPGPWRFRGAGSVSGAAISNVLLSASVRKGLVVLYSRDAEDTASVVLRACRAISRPAKSSSRRYIESRAPDRRLPGLSRTSRGGSCDAAAAGAAMLTVVPGVSAAIAEAVMAGHKSISGLIESLSRLDVDARVPRLAEVRHGASQRRLGEAVAKRILDHVMIV